jgi:hypothetical protein
MEMPDIHRLPSLLKAIVQPVKLGPAIRDFGVVPLFDIGGKS